MKRNSLASLAVQRPANRPVTVLLMAVMANMFSAGCASVPSAPEVHSSSTVKVQQNFNRNSDQRKTVTIYKFKSTVREISVNNATDMFTTALIKSGAFTVVERQRLNEGVMQERQMNTRGMTTGNSSQQQFIGADYIFEGVVTEANPSSSKTGVAATVEGVGVETSGEEAELGLDIRIIDARTGVVVDAVNVRKKVKEGGFSATGTGTLMRRLSKGNVKGANLDITKEKKEGIDRALRECIDEAIYEIAQRH